MTAVGVWRSAEVLSLYMQREAQGTQAVIYSFECFVCGFRVVCKSF